MGPSGAGKSSLLRAGLLAAIAHRGALPVAGSSDWPQVVLTPTAHPLDALTAALPEPLPGRLVVVVDQLEELFTLCHDLEERHRFLDRLAEFAAGPAAVVYGLRIDAYAHCLDHPALREAAQHGQVVVGPMTEAELRQAVVCPSHETGLDLEPGLVDVLLRDLGVTEDGYEAGRLPLLAHALRALWRERHGHLLTLAGYRTTGGITDAVATTAESVYIRLDELDRRTARALFIRLVRIADEPAGDTRRAVPCAELPGDVLDTFVTARLLTRDADRVTITHEVLLRAWPRLRSWLDENRTANLTRQQLEDAATAWAADDRDPALLFRGNRLDSARTWAPSVDLSPTGAEFVTASAHQAIRARRKRQALVAVLAVLTLVASVTAAIAVYQQRTAQEALKQIVAANLVTKAQQLRTSGTRARQVLAAQLDLIAWRLREDTNTDDPMANTGLVIDASVALSFSAEDSPGLTYPVISPVFSPDGRTLAMYISGGGGGGSVRFWHVADWPDIRRLPGAVERDGAMITFAEFSPDGRLLAVSWSDGQVQLWRIQAGKPPQYVRTIDASGERARGTQGPHGSTDDNSYADQVALFLDNAVLAVGHHATNVDNVDVSATRLWDVSTPDTPAPLGPILQVNGKNTGLVTVDRHRHVIVTSSSGMDDPESATHETVLWDATDPHDPAVRGTFGSSYNSVVPNYVAIHPKAHTAAVINSDKDDDIELWNIADLTDPTQVGTLPKVGDLVAGATMTYHPRQDTIAVSYRGDSVIRLWEVTNPADARLIGQPLTGHSGFINSMAYNANGKVLATGGYGHTNHTIPPISYEARLWNFDIEENVAYLCSTTAEITQQQWSRYVPPNLDYDPPCASLPTDR